MIALKEMFGKCGVYSITHRSTSRVYIGSSIDIGIRIRNHIAASKRGETMCISRSLREIGLLEFDCAIVEICDRSILRHREKYWIGFFNSASVNGFNTQSDPTVAPERAGAKMSAATIARIQASKLAKYPNGSPKPENFGEIMSAINKSRVWTEEMREKSRKGSTGKKQSAETIAKKRAAMIGRIVSAATREKLRIANTGKKCPSEVASKISATLKGVPQPPAAAAKSAASRTGLKRNEETKAKIGAKMKGRKIAGEWLDKLVASRNATWEKKRAMKIILDGEIPRKLLAATPSTVLSARSELFHIPQSTQFPTSLQMWALEQPCE